MCNKLSASTVVINIWLVFLDIEVFEAPAASEALDQLILWSGEGKKVCGECYTPKLSEIVGYIKETVISLVWGLYD